MNFQQSMLPSSNFGRARLPFRRGISLLSFFDTVRSAITSRLSSAGDATYLDIFREFSHMASNNPEKLNRRSLHFSHSYRQPLLAATALSPCLLKGEPLNSGGRSRPWTTQEGEGTGLTEFLGPAKMGTILHGLQPCCQDSLQFQCRSLPKQNGLSPAPA